MRDYFDRLGLPRDARADEIRRACARRTARLPPDFDGESAGSSIAVRPDGRESSMAELSDVAIDFVDMSVVADRMRVAFFRTEP